MNTHSATRKIKRVKKFFCLVSSLRWLLCFRFESWTTFCSMHAAMSSSCERSPHLSSDHNVTHRKPCSQPAIPSYPRNPVWANRKFIFHKLNECVWIVNCVTLRSVQTKTKNSRENRPVANAEKLWWERQKPSKEIKFVAHRQTLTHVCADEEKWTLTNCYE